ncbi:DNA cytosine methyltransferase [Billgrantia desiderata]|uniref:DNA cytosine methyltransferase n=1 Tax=Billgrantia desiderata TaxID=52021 RepID=UPI00089EB3EE|nr:DNA cytosine methyltransferase [Halomonas desiderata]SEG30805.1 C-5 cytosine-specific DNA methylase [Halomonas desiderata]
MNMKAKISSLVEYREIRHFQLFCGLGGGGRGFNRGNARIGNMVARYRCVGGIDIDAGAIADFQRLTGAPGTVMDLFSREQYVAFHGQEPPPDWREATPADLRRAAGGERPHIGFTSSPCKGLSGLLNETLSKTAKYQALNELTLRGIWLLCEAWADDPLEFILFENVPRIASRGRHLLDQICALLESYGYAVAETTHDCGELGGLAQSRKRFLLVARHQAKVPPFLYEPQKRPLRAVGDVLEKLPLPGDIELGGPMHRVPSLQWRTWVRLAMVEAGKDWRSLERLRVEDGMLADYGIVPGRGWHSGIMGVNRWNETCGTVTSSARPTNGAFSIADPRIDGHPRSVQHGVRRWDQPAPVVTGKMFVGGGPHSVADPRLQWHHAASRNKYRVVRWDQRSGTVISARGPADGAGCIADPRVGFGGQRQHYQTGGHYGVVAWDAATGAVSGAARHDSGRFSVADPRATAAHAIADALPAQTDRGVYIIVSEDGTWHRPFTTLELASLQSLVDPEEYLELEGLSDSAWRERIGNAVPPDAAKAIADVMGTTLLLAWAGETFALGSTPIWVRQVAVGLTVAASNAEEGRA